MAPTLTACTPCDKTYACIQQVGESAGWHTRHIIPCRAHMEEILARGIDAILFDMPHVSAAMTNCIDIVSETAPFVPFIFISGEALYLQELGVGLRYHIPADNLDDLQHILISIGCGFTLQEMDFLCDIGESTVPRVLVIDDNIQLLTLMGRSLRSYERMDVRVVDSGIEAVSMMPSFHPHVVVVDLGIADMNAADVCTFIRKHKRLQDTKILGLTTMTPLGASNHVYLDVVVRKPFLMHELVQNVLELIPNASTHQS